MPVTHRDVADHRVTTSAASRLFRRPHPHFTWPEFTDLMVRSMLIHGDAFALARRNERHEITSLEPMPTRGAAVLDVVEDGEPHLARFYDFHLRNDDGSPFLAPARDVLHLRAAIDPARPTRGLAPLAQAGVALGIAREVYSQQISFHRNGARPSALVSTDQELTREQITMLRQSLSDLSEGMNTGRVPILSNGLKWESLSLSAQDTHVIDLLANAGQDIASVFGVPSALIGAGESSQYKVHSDVISGWLSLSLNPLIEKVEQALAHLLRLAPGESIRLDSSSLFRLDPTGHGQHLARLTGAGILTANEARAALSYSAADGGDELRVPVSLYAEEEAPDAPPVADDIEERALPELVRKVLPLRRAS